MKKYNSSTAGKAPSSVEDAGLIAVGRQQAQQRAPEVTKLLAAVLGQDALPNGFQWDVARHARDHLLHEPCEHLLQGCPPLPLQFMNLDVP